MHHVRDGVGGGDNLPASQPVWRYEKKDIFMAPTNRLLVRILVGKVKNHDQLETVFESTPLRAHIDGWNCVEWLKEALESAGREGKALGTAITSWQSVRDTAMWYIDFKHKAGRFGEHYNTEEAPTWDMLGGSEIIP